MSFKEFGNWWALQLPNELRLRGKMPIDRRLARETGLGPVTSSLTAKRSTS